MVGANEDYCRDCETCRYPGCTLEPRNTDGTVEGVSQRFCSDEHWEMWNVRMEPGPTTRNPRVIEVDAMELVEQ